MTKSLMLGAVSVAAVALAGCVADPPPPQRDLRRPLSALDTVVRDTAVRRQRLEFEKCAYVYNHEGGLRECLVMRYAWPPQDAERRIAIYKAELRRELDSLQRVADSVQAVKLAEVARQEDARLRAASAEERRLDSIYQATRIGSIELRQPGTAIAPDGAIELDRRDSIRTSALVSRVLDGNGLPVKNYKLSLSIYYPDEHRTLHFGGDILPLEPGVNEVTVAVNGTAAEQTLRFRVRE